MLVAYFQALIEVIHRRLALVLVGIALVVGFLFNAVVKIHVGSGVTLITVGTQSLGEPKIAVPLILGTLISQAGSLWMLLALCGGIALLSAMLERGWIEILFSKATPEYAIVLGHYLAGITVYFATFLIASTPLAARLWWQTGEPTWPIFYGLLTQCLSFASILAVALVATLPRTGFLLPMASGMAIWFFSPLLAKRVTAYYPMVESHTVRTLIDVLYRILPKNSELEGLSASLLQSRHINEWWPIWSTALFAATVITVSLITLRRKALS